MMPAPRALIVDDSPPNLKLAEFVLSSGGFDVCCASDGHDGLRQVESFLPDVVLMDIQLPGLDGLAVARRLKSNPSTAHIIVIAFTAYAMKGDAEKMVAAGCDGYLSKPIDVTTFAAQVNECLGLRGADSADATNGQIFE